MPLSIRIKLPQTNGRVVGQEFDNFRKRMQAKAREVLSDSIQEELTTKRLRVEEDLANSWDYELEETTGSDLIRAGSADIAANALEYGTSPATGGIVNVAEIKKWIQKKPVTVSYGTIDNFAWALAKKIGKEGLPLGTKGLRRPFANARKRAQRRMSKEWENGIAELVSKLNG